MSNEETVSTSIWDFSRADDEDDQDNYNKQKVKEKKEEENKLSFYKPSITINDIQLTFFYWKYPAIKNLLSILIICDLFFK